MKVEIQLCESRLDLHPAVLRGLPQAWEHRHNPRWPVGSSTRCLLSGSCWTSHLGSLSLPPPARHLICWHRFPRGVKEGTNIPPQCAGNRHLKP